MPSERFFNLDAEKRDRILTGARKEFARVPYEEVSINQIIKNAGISRGSFYTYFEDKRDLLNYIFDKQGEQGFQYLKDQVLQCGGDFWAGLREWTRWIILIRNSESMKEGMAIMLNAGLLRNLQSSLELNIKHTRPDSMAYIPKRENGDRIIDWLIAHVKPECLGLPRPRQEIEVLFAISMGVSVIHILSALTYPEEMECTLRNLDTALHFLQHGAGWKGADREVLSLAEGYLQDLPSPAFCPA